VQRRPLVARWETASGGGPADRAMVLDFARWETPSGGGPLDRTTSGGGPPGGRAGLPAGEMTREQDGRWWGSGDGARF
jgi:hypothetical protein